MSESTPRFPIRRFDVFADYNRIRNQDHGMPEDLAKGRAIWAAKVVAGRRYGAAPATKGAGKETARPQTEAERQVEEEGFRSVGGVEQTDKTFDKEIIDRMGSDFYHHVFHPAIEQAFHEGKRYEDIRDSIRKDWK